MTGDRCKQTCKRDFIKDCFQGADLAERWDSSFPYFLPNCCLDFSCDGGTPAVVLDNHVTLEMDSTQALAGPVPALFQWERKINFLLLKL